VIVLQGKRKATICICSPQRPELGAEGLNHSPVGPSIKRRKGGRRGGCSVEGEEDGVDGVYMVARTRVFHSTWRGKRDQQIQEPAPSRRGVKK